MMGILLKVREAEEYSASLVYIILYRPIQVGLTPTCTDLVQFYPPSLLASSVGKPYSQLRETYGQKYKRDWNFGIWHTDMHSGF